MTTIKRRRVEITIFEQERVVQRSMTARCPVCELQSEMLTLAQAGELAQVRAESIHRWLTEGMAHGVKTPDGQDRICKNSLFLEIAHQPPKLLPE